jgi:hypothetical protein
MLKDLIKIAGELDLLGLKLEADIVDSLIRKIAGPLIDVAEWETGGGDLKLTTEDEKIRNKDTERKGVGWGLSPEEVDTTKWIMKKSPGDWVFVIPDNVYKIREKIKSKSFKKWLKNKMYGDQHYIFVVGSTPFPDDFSDPQWIVHDLVGHSVGRKFDELLRSSGVMWGNWINREDVKIAIDKIWGLIPPELQNAEKHADRLTDISAAIMFGSITLEEALGAISSIQTDNMESLRDSITLMFTSVSSWLEDQEWLDVGGNKVSVIEPWNNGQYY